MQLCLVRHGDAVAADGGYANDGLRPLTADGRARMHRGAAGLIRVFTPAGIVSSPLVRARQTAEILQGAWPKPALRFSEHLATGDHEALLAEVAGFGWERTVLVGHEPHLSHLFSLLLSGSPARVIPDFKRGAAAIVDLDDLPNAIAGGAQLLAFYPPAALRAMRKKG